MASSTTQKLDTPQALFVHELSDIRSAEGIILTMLEEAIEAVSNTQLKAGLKAHHKQTEQHLANVDQVFALIGEQPEAIECKGAKGLHEEAQEAIKEKPAPEILDSMIASGAMKTEHYEIVAYEGLVDQAKSARAVRSCQAPAGKPEGRKGNPQETRGAGAQALDQSRKDSVPKPPTWVSTTTGAGKPVPVRAYDTALRVAGCR